MRESIETAVSIAQWCILNPILCSKDQSVPTTILDFLVERVYEHAESCLHLIATCPNPQPSLPPAAAEVYELVSSGLAVAQYCISSTCSPSNVLSLVASPPTVDPLGIGASPRAAATCYLEGIFDTDYGTVVMDGPTTGKFYAHYQDGQGNWNYYSSGWTVTVNLGAKGFVADWDQAYYVPEHGLVTHMRYDVTWDSDCITARGTLSFNHEAASASGWWSRPFIRIYELDPLLGLIGFRVFGPAGPDGIGLTDAPATFMLTGKGQTVFKQTTSATYESGAWYETTGVPYYHVILDRLNVGRDEYPSIVAVWEKPGGNFPHTYVPPTPLKVKGWVYYTQYNTPDQADASCQGSPVDAWVADAACAFTKVDPSDPGFSQLFIDQVHTNGTGRTAKFGLIKSGRPQVSTLGTKCKNKFPAGANTENSFLKITSVTGNCLSVLTPDVSIAVAPGAGKRGSEYACGEAAALVNVDNAYVEDRKAEDTCGKCNEDPTGHYDAYSSNPSCYAWVVADRGTFWTLKR